MEIKIDDISKALRAIRSDLPAPRMNLPAEELRKLMLKVGPRTVKSLLAAKKQLPEARIPFLFNGLDAQDVLDILNNSWDDILPLEKPK